MSSIAFFDSGAGGLPYLKMASERFPERDYIYLADTAHLPYGPRSEQDIIALTEKGIRKLLRQTEIEALVIACNTASVTALAEMRRLFSFPIVGVVPAVKPAALVSREKRIGVLATDTTVRSPYVKNLIDSFASGASVHLVAAGDIVHFVEHCYFTSTEQQVARLVLPAAEELRKLDVDTVVLGCTHFIYVEDLLRKSLGDQVRLVDSREGVINQLFRVAPDKKSPETGPVRLFCSGDSSDEDVSAGNRYRRFAESFGFQFSGVLND